MGSKSKLLGKDLSHFFGNFLQLDSAQKMRETSKQWIDVKIYENVFPKESGVTVFKNVNTGEIFWETIQFTEPWDTMPEQEKLESYLRRNDCGKWNDVFLWFCPNRCDLVKNDVFLNQLMFAIAENCADALTN